MGTEAWARPPKDKRPAAWAKLRDPVCLLKRALYGHLDAGSCWEVFAEEKIRSIGFEPIPNWPGLFFRKDMSVMLSVYVDDLKAAAPHPPEGVGRHVEGTECAHPDRASH